MTLGEERGMILGEGKDERGRGGGAFPTVRVEP